VTIPTNTHAHASLETRLLGLIGHLLYSMRFLMIPMYVGLVAVIFFIAIKFMKESFKLGVEVLNNSLTKIDMIIRVLELVDLTMVAQLVWVVTVAGFALFVSSHHFDKVDGERKPDWLAHVDTYNLKQKLAFSIISISGVHALRTYLEGKLSVYESLVVIIMHSLFVLSAVGIAYAIGQTASSNAHAPAQAQER
jgi:uncharacterized protein (TIGR00645 family)